MSKNDVVVSAHVPDEIEDQMSAKGTTNNAAKDVEVQSGVTENTVPPLKPNSKIKVKNKAAAGTVAGEPKVKGPTVITVIFKGPGMAYNFHGRTYNKGVANRVKAVDAPKLLKTGLFERLPDNALPPGVSSGDQLRKKQYRVGAFQTKQEAIDYASKMHGITLGVNLSLQDLNERCAMLYRGAKTFQRTEHTADVAVVPT